MGRPPDFAADIDLALAFERHALLALEQCQQRQEQARQAVRGVADGYHPFDAQTRRPLSATAVDKE